MARLHAVLNIVSRRQSVTKLISCSWFRSPAYSSMPALSISTAHRSSRYFSSSPISGDCSNNAVPIARLDRNRMRKALYALVVLLLTAYAIAVWRYWGIPLELIRLIEHAEHLMKRVEAIDDVDDPYRNDALLQQERQNLLNEISTTYRQALAYIELRTPASELGYESSNVQLHSSTTSLNVPFSESNFVQPHLLQHVLCRLALSIALQSHQQYDCLCEAEDFYLRAIRLILRDRGLYSPQVVEIIRQLAQVYIAQGRLDNAERALIRASELIKTIQSKNPLSMYPSKSISATIRNLLSFMGAPFSLVGTMDTFSPRVASLIDKRAEQHIAQTLAFIFFQKGDPNHAIAWALHSLRGQVNFLPEQLRCAVRVLCPVHTTKYHNSNTVKAVSIQHESGMNLDEDVATEVRVTSQLLHLLLECWLVQGKFNEATAAVLANFRLLHDFLQKNEAQGYDMKQDLTSREIDIGEYEQTFHDILTKYPFATNVAIQSEVAIAVDDMKRLLATAEKETAE